MGNSVNKDKMLMELIQELAVDVNLNQEKIRIYRDRFEEIYCDDYRHEYSAITRVLFDITEDESRDYLSEKLKDIMDLMSDGEAKKGLAKLWDHINLENVRMAELRRISSVSIRQSRNANKKQHELKIENKKLNEDLKAAKEELKYIREKFDEVEENITNSNVQSITILGIFSGIVMAFTGGLSFIASSLQNINVISKYRLIFVILLLAAAIFNIIFMLIYVIGKLTNKYIGSKCNCNNEFIGCRDKDTKCSVVRYPLVIWVNVAIVFGLIATTSLYFIDKYNIPSLIKDTCNIGPIEIIIIFAIIVISILLLSWRVVKKLLLIECKYEESEGIFGSISKILSGNKYKKKEQYKK